MTRFADATCDAKTLNLVSADATALKNLHWVFLEGLDEAATDRFGAAFLRTPRGFATVSRNLKHVLAPVNGRDDGILDYTQYSVRMDRIRRLAIYTAVNIDGNEAHNVGRGRDEWSLDPRRGRSEVPRLPHSRGLLEGRGDGE